MNERPLVVPGRVLAAAPDLDGLGDIGGKARGLLAIEAAGLPTAPWLVVRASARPADRRVVPELERALAEGLRELGPDGGGRFAVRSSGLDEDAAGHSFAGQYETVLDVPADRLAQAIERCWRSADTEGVRAYRQAMGLPPVVGDMAVIVQRMVRPTWSGVAFSTAPDGTPVAVVVGVPGLGKELVAGRQTGDEVRVANDGLAVRRTSRASDAGPRLDPEVARRVAAAARELEARLGAPQDVEWCLTATGELVLVQTRPITAAARRPIGGDTVRLWTNANIVESFPGVTLPLTFSVAREAYAIVYRGACRALGVADAAIRREADAFDGLLGHMRGRVYYDVGKWHRVLALLPAFRSNQALLERMMGAARPGGGAGERAAAVNSGGIPLRSAATIAWRLLAVLATFERRARRFTAAQRRTLRDAPRVDLAAMPPEALVRHLDDVTARVLGRWQLPIFNDLAVMLFHGSLRRAAERWCDPSAAGSLNALLRSGAHPGVAAGNSLRRIAEALRGEPAWLAVAEAGDAATARRVLDTDPALEGLRRLLEPYLAGWGGRPPGALHLDRPDLTNDPRLLLVTLRDLATARGDGPADPAATDPAAVPLPSPARLVVHGSPPVRIVRRALLRFLLHRARYHLTWRERMRLLRMDVFAVGREIVSALDRAWVAAGVLEAPGDVHYLEIGEVRAATADAEAAAALASLAAGRRRAFDAMRLGPPPPNRFEWDGTGSPPAAGDAAGAPADDARRLVGTGVSPGRAHGSAVVVSEPRDTPHVAGRVVVATSTDPGWLPLMLAARGLVVEQGSLLSHSAIVARELGLPAVVGVTGATSVLAAGQRVAVDGSSGVVEVLEPEAGVGDA